jgi:Uma2 family endonuclease
MSMALARHRFTVAEYERMAETGIFTEDDRVELIAGEVVDMSPMGAGHLRCINRLGLVLYRALGDAYEISPQNPIRLGEHDEPEPDFAVLRRQVGVDTMPAAAEALLVIEVGDSSREHDRSVKFPRYAAAGIPEAWLVDLIARRLERHTMPGPDGYQQITLVRPGQTLASTVLPNLVLAADAILGPVG